jgi:hypothetical protein
MESWSVQRSGQSAIAIETSEMMLNETEVLTEQIEPLTIQKHEHIIASSKSRPRQLKNRE